MNTATGHHLERINIMSKQRTTLLALALSLTAASTLATTVKQNTAPIPPSEYDARVAAAMADPKTHAAGKRAAFLCVYCHGEDGNSVQENIPNLAGQNPTYLLTQIQKFGDGRRNDEFMSGLIKALSNEDRVSMAVYYASMKPNTPGSKDAGLIERGKKRFMATCVGCHGPKAAGSKLVARLAGQRESYLTLALNNYRSSKSPRTDPVMTLVARKLDAADIPAVTAYLSTLK
jgi:cytochrome c553